MRVTGRTGNRVAVPCRHGRHPDSTRPEEENPVATAHKQQTDTHSFSTHIDIPADARARLTEQLNESLACTFDLMSQVKQAHWNVKGKDFYQLHLLFDEIAEELEGFVDELAERVTSLGGYARGTARMAAANSTLPEYPTDVIEGLAHVTALVERFAPYVAHVRDAIEVSDEIGDPTTADLYTEISRTVDKRLWFLEAHIQG
jgi:starvation-inducible DNA-binding protein